MLTYAIRRGVPRAWFEAERSSGRSGGSRLPIDLSERDEAYELMALVPGLNPDDVTIEVENGVLTLRGKAPTAEDGQGDYLLREIAPLEFERRLRLPLPVDAGRAEASLEHGLLKIRIPKAEEARPKMIQVRAG